MGASRSPRRRTSRLPPWAALDTAQQESDAFLVAFSGGADSTALLHRLMEARRAGKPPFHRRTLPLAAAHVHHGLQAQADAWLAHCAEQCAAWGVPFFAARVTVDAQLCTRLGLEAAARRARYRALATLAHDWAAELARSENRLTPLRITVVTAHHRDDQVETFWFRLLRGSGVLGLGAMRPWGPYPLVCSEPESRVACDPCLAAYDGRTVRLNLWRPLLTTSKSALVAYLREQRITWHEDPTNQTFDTKAHGGMRRNALRHALLPALRRTWPGLDAVSERTARVMQEAHACLMDLAEIDAAAIVDGAGRWRLDSFSALPAHRQRNLLRWALQANGWQPPPEARLDEALRQLAAHRSARKHAPWTFRLTAQALLCADRQGVWLTPPRPTP